MLPPWEFVRHGSLSILRDYQVELVDAVAAAVEKRESGICIAPCGSGKSVCMLAVLQDLQPAMAIIFVPLLGLARLPMVTIMGERTDRISKVNPETDQG